MTNAVSAGPCRYYWECIAYLPARRSRRSQLSQPNSEGAFTGIFYCGWWLVHVSIPLITGPVDVAPEGKTSTSRSDRRDPFRRLIEEVGEKLSSWAHRRSTSRRIAPPCTADTGRLPPHTSALSAIPTAIDPDVLEAGQRPGRHPRRPQPSAPKRWRPGRWSAPLVWVDGRRDGFHHPDGPERCRRRQGVTPTTADPAARGSIRPATDTNAGK